MSTLIRPLVPTMEFGLRFDMKRIPNSIGLFLFMLFLSVVGSAQSDSTLSCYGRVNMSITNSGVTYIKPVHVTGRHDLTNLEVILQDRSTPRLRCSDIGDVIMYTLRDTVIGISCWGELMVEDKLPYNITCNDGTALCSSKINPADFLTVEDNCLNLSDLQVGYADSIGQDFPMGSDTLRIVTRTWTTTDPDGIVRSCISKIHILPLDINTIEFPKDTTISCDQNPLDTAITGGLNVSAELQQQNCCIGFTIQPIEGPLLFACGTKKKYVRSWEAFDWCNGTMKSSMQIIIVEADKEKTKLVAPTSFERVNNGCETGLILGAPTFVTDCAEFTIENTEVFITSEGEIITAQPVGDTVYLDPGEYQFIYRPNATCVGTIKNDTTNVSVSSLIKPILVCSDSLNKIISIGSLDSLRIDLDQVYRNTNIQACGVYNVLGRKLDSMGVATTEFDSIMTLFLSETSSKLRVELTVKSENGLYSDTCTVWIDVQENVAPVLTLHPNINAPIVDINGMLILDTSAIIASLMDNSGCISSIVITGSGSVLSGSGPMMTGSLTWFMDGQFETFECEDIGTYNVKVAVSDCDNNMTMDTTSLTITNGGGCPMSATISGRVLAYGSQPVSGVDVSLLGANNIYIASTDLEGKYNWDEVEGGEEYDIELAYADLWETGLTAHDLSLLQHYVLGIEHFDMYQKASADIDGNGVINVSDFLTLQKILMGKEVVATLDRQPWIFSNTVENGIFIPFEAGSISVGAGKRLDWQAVKSGDVDRDALNKGGTRSISSIPVDLISSSQDGFTYRINFGHAGDLRAFQGSLDFIDTDIEVVSHHNELDYKIQSGILSMLYYDKDPFSQNEDDIQLTIRSQKEINEFDFSNNQLNAYAWDRSGDRTKMYLQLQNIGDLPELSNSDLLISAFPNPTSDGIVLELSNTSGTAKPISIIVTDVLGAVFTTKPYVITPSAALEQVYLELPAQSGVYIVSVQSPDNQEHIRISKN